MNATGKIQCFIPKTRFVLSIAEINEPLSGKASHYRYIAFGSHII